jgi:diguanylate cyclase (GGDEF)-like protein
MVHSFSFNDKTPGVTPLDDTELLDQSLMDANDMRRAVAAAGQAAYRWNLMDDHLIWSPEVEAVLSRDRSSLDTGRKFAAHLDPENLTSRYDTVFNSKVVDEGEGVPYHLEYQLKNDSIRGLPGMWVEDTGRWYGNGDGRPVEAIGVVRPIDDRHNRDQHLSTLSHTDALTGMMNRGRMEEALTEVIDAARSNSAPAAFAVAAIRNLDVVNEAYGFDVADQVISAIAARLKAVMRTGDGIARYSGSKFGFILNACDKESLCAALDRFLTAARDAVVETTGGPVWALLSMGAVLLPHHAHTAPEAKSLAEESLSTALRQSSDGYVVHEPSETAKNNRMLNALCAAEIVECLRGERFQLAFQPMVDVVSGKIFCHEALLRMRDNAGELVAAAHLVPVAERLGLIRLIDRAVVQMALATLHAHADARLSINISATTANDPRWNSQIIEMIDTANAVADRLTVEITETTALSDLTSAVTFLERLRSVGCCVAIDDFGAGFTSFRNLRDLPIDIIKLDGSYCRNLAKDPENVYFARTLIEMAHHFGIRTVAEWVETEGDAEILSAMGIDFLQGNFIGVPSVSPPWESDTAPTFDFGSPAAPVATAVHHDDGQDAIAASVMQFEATEEPAPEPVADDTQGDVFDSTVEVTAEVEVEAEAVVAFEMTSPAQEIAMDVIEADILAFAALEDNVAVPPADHPADAVEDIFSDNLLGDVDSSLSKLREALALLNDQFGTPTDSGDQLRRTG